MRITRKIGKRAGIVLAGSIATIALAGGTAFASGSPTTGTESGQPANVPVSASVSMSCGFAAGDAPTAINFGSVTPGEPATATTTYSVQCNDSNGYIVYVTDLGGGSTPVLGVPTISGDNGALTDSIYTLLTGSNVHAVNPFASNNPTQGDSGTYSATPVSYTDTWTLDLPTSVLYPGQLTDEFSYGVFGQ